MEDRELLERAARAAGIDWDRDSEGWFSSDQYVRMDWNPLTDDGDAFRLAVKLGLGDAVRDGYQHIDSDCDLYAATRRAIVRAAAALSKGA